VAFVIGCVSHTAGTRAQIVLTQVVPRAAAGRSACQERAGELGRRSGRPGVAGALIKLVARRWRLLADACLLLASVLILRGLKITESRRDSARQLLAALQGGPALRRRQRLLVVLAAAGGHWQMCHHAAMVVQILFATRELGLNERQVGLCYIGLGVGTVLAGALGHRLSRAIGTGPCLLLGFASAASAGCSSRWRRPTAGAWPVFVADAGVLRAGAVLIFINFLALRQAVTPEPLLGRMTSTMRWLILLPAAPGRVAGGLARRALSACAGRWPAGGRRRARAGAGRLEASRCCAGSAGCRRRGVGRICPRSPGKKNPPPKRWSLIRSRRALRPRRVRISGSGASRHAEHAADRARVVQRVVADGRRRSCSRGRLLVEHVLDRAEHFSLVAELVERGQVHGGKALSLQSPGTSMPAVVIALL
jgi:hypothetical protein